MLAPGLAVLFVGINPGLYSGATGRHFARPGNRFWPALHRAGLTDRLLHPAEESQLLARGIGISKLVNRATATAAELTDVELRRGGARVRRLVRDLRARAVCFLGVGAHCRAYGLKRATIGLQPEPFEGARLWVLPNPSGLNANYQLPDFVRLFTRLRRSVDAEPTDRGPVVGQDVADEAERARTRKRRTDGNRATTNVPRPQQKMPFCFGRAVCCTPNETGRSSGWEFERDAPG